MDMTTRQLREALKAKLDHRRKLMAQNRRLQGDVGRERERNKFLVSTLSNPLVNIVLEDCADQIISEIISEAIRLSEVVAIQTIDNGDYEIGLSIRNFEIRHRVSRLEPSYVGGPDYQTPDRRIKRISVKSRDRGHP